VFAVALAVVVGNRIENVDVFAILVGCITGVAAGIPVSLLLLIAMHNREQKRASRAELERARAANRLHSWGPMVSITGLIESGEEDRPRRADN